MNSPIKLLTIYALLTLLMAGCTQGVNFGQNISPDQAKSSTPVCTETDCTPTQTVNETFNAPPAAYKADIVFVMNTSPTMFTTITQMANHLGSFISSLTNVDYQIGVLNASLSSYDAGLEPFKPGQLLTLNTYPSEMGAVSYLKPGNDWNEAVLAQNLDFYGLTWPVQTGEPSFCDQQPYCTAGSPEPMKALATAMAAQTGTNAGFFRPGSYLVPIIISANEENFGDSGAAQAQDVVDAFQKNWGATMAGLRDYNFIIKPGDSTCLDQYSSIFKLGSGGQYGASFDQLAQKTGGQSFSICSADYSQPLLSALSSGFAPAVTTITLKQAPISGTLKIVANPSADLNYSVNGQTITFSQALPPGTRLSVSYQTNN